MLADLTRRARLRNRRIDKAALCSSQSGRPYFYESDDLVQLFSRAGPPRWTRTLDVS